ncbi:MAG: DNA-binding protein [Candidatus Omnitrophica bacterium]|nr:DNA-binding protein [Candidatus Omnitrophota bacterium]
MKKIAIACVLISCLSTMGVCAAAAAEAQRVSSAELIEKAKEFDGKQVIYRGELVTAILDRGEYSWANVNDGNNAIGVWCLSSALKPVKFIGDYKYKGDVIEVRGVFHRACSLHGGELDIHAESVEVKASGYRVKQWFSVRKLILALALLLLTSYVITRFINRM